MLLAKQRWPELVASERKKDLGLDAFVLRSQASDSVGRGLACSISPTPEGVGRRRYGVEEFPDAINILIFATSR